MVEDGIDAGVSEASMPRASVLRPPVASADMGTGAVDEIMAAPRRAGDRERGAALVEFAIIAPLLITLLFGIIDFGYTFYEAAAQRQGTQQSARMAAVGNHGSCSGTATEKIVCQTKSMIGFDDVRVRVVVPDTYTRGNTIIVCSERNQRSITGFFTPLMSGRYSRSVATVRIEQQSTTETPTTGGDAAYSGGWGWCV
jgi:hypothetical protein